MSPVKYCFYVIKLSTFFYRLRNKFFRLIESKEYSWDEDSQRYLLMAMLMTSSDLAASTKQWHVQQRAARLVTDEFIEQGDKERFELNIQPQALMDRERQHELPQLQIRWIADICLPLYQVELFAVFVSRLQAIASRRVTSIILEDFRHFEISHCRYNVQESQ